MANELTAPAAGEILQSGLDEFSLARHPAKVLEEAKQAATALTDVIRQTRAVVKLGNSEHLKLEAWTTCARFYGCTVRTRDPEPVEIGGVMGFKAEAEVLAVVSGQVIGRATAYCMRDEERWSERPKYEWKTVAGKRERIQVGTEPVPLFQVASMAQTRAASKALKNVFSWVVVLAGFNPTPAEEMDQADREEAPAAAPAAAAPAQAAPAARRQAPAQAAAAPAQAKALPAAAPAKAAPQRAAAAPPVTGGSNGFVQVVECGIAREGVKRNGDPWTSYFIKDAAGGKYFTFDSGLYKFACDARDSGEPVKLITEQKGEFTNLVDVVFLPPEAKAAAALEGDLLPPEDDGANSDDITDGVFDDAPAPNPPTADRRPR